MSENSFENSTYSENNSYDEGSSNPPEPMSPPIKRASLDDDYVANGVYGSRLTSDLLTSLPVLSPVSSNSQPYRAPYIKDAELSELLMRKQPKFAPLAPKCAKCNKNVYKAEETRAANKTFHKLCFKCTACNKLLEPNILTEHAGDLFCKNCYAKNFGPKGYGVGLALPTSPDTSFSSSSSMASPPASSNFSTAASSSSASSSTSSLSNGSGSTASPALKWTFSSVPGSNGLVQTKTSTSHINSACNQEKRLSVSCVSGPVVIATGETSKCARCTKPVYAAEKISAAGKTYHKLCFNCASCKKMLSSMNCCDNSEGDIFCKSCYGRQYGPKGVGYGIGAGTLQANS